MQKLAKLLILLLLLASGIEAQDDVIPGDILLELVSGASWEDLNRDKSLPAMTKRGDLHALEKRSGRKTMLLQGGKSAKDPKATHALVAQFAKHPLVAAAAPNHIRTRNDIVIPQDPNFGFQYGLENENGPDIEFLAAWRLASRDAGTAILGVMDTGIDYRHPDLRPNLWQNAQEIPGNEIDDDNNGYIDDVFGVDASGDDDTSPFSNEADGDPMDAGLGLAHGTHVAGIAGAMAGNGRGVNGVHIRTRILTLKASPDGNFFTTFGVVNGINYVLDLIDRGEPIVAINMSFGGGSFNTIENNAIAELNEAGVIAVTAAGNSANNNDTNPAYPSNYPQPNIISVASSDSADNLSSFSNFGTNTVDIAAPGSNIYSTKPTHIDSTAEVTFSDNSSIECRGMFFSGLTDDEGISGTLVDSGLGYPDDFPAAVNGNIALIERGEIFFSTKIANATTAGAIGCVIYNNEPGLFNGRLIQPSGLNIPAVAADQADFTTLSAQLGETITLLNAFNEDQGYEFSSGTSMSAPMVAAAVAFAADHYPDDNPAQRIGRVLAAADTVPELATSVSAGRRLNLRRIVDGDNDGAGDGLPDWWELEAVGNLDTMTPDGDEDEDGISNWREFLIGTNPVDAKDGLRLSIDQTRTLRWDIPAYREHFIESAPEVVGPWTRFSETMISAATPGALPSGDMAERELFRLAIPE